MSQTAKAYMLAQMAAYFAKVKAAVVSGGSASFRYKTGSVPANGQIVIDAPTELGFTAAQYHVYSLGVQLSMVDPTVGTNPPVVEASGVLTYQIQADGKLVIKSNFATGPVTYYARITMPVKI
ncbi:hypothetical protein ST201phi2-1p299 [Pseudomonas phage 201phi2-1]|uniref:Uncharacterized protein n=1 Tax=Pseudomonas phage 201phi2-1 TaxID=198110 RepID=B3FJF9_BP201|nr:hypothetical protein ST201phi2-1p299 [Pseudomonas phage 201phi2-1]ABY63125.1 protein of unknown function [Pseudomonas phage 201phi2-1]